MRLRPGNGLRCVVFCGGSIVIFSFHTVELRVVSFVLIQEVVVGCDDVRFTEHDLKSPGYVALTIPGRGIHPDHVHLIQLRQNLVQQPRLVVQDWFFSIQDFSGAHFSPLGI